MYFCSIEVFSCTSFKNGTFDGFLAALENLKFTKACVISRRPQALLGWRLAGCVRSCLIGVVAIRNLIIFIINVFLLTFEVYTIIFK